MTKINVIAYPCVYTLIPIPMLYINMYDLKNENIFSEIVARLKKGVYVYIHRLMRQNNNKFIN